MTENKHGKKPVLEGVVRIHKELDKALEMEAARIGQFKYAVVQMAWDAYERQQSGDYVPKETIVPQTATPIHGVAPNLDIDLDSVVSEGLSPLEITITRKLISVLRAEKPGLAEALISNIDQFADAAQLWSAAHSEAQPGKTKGAGISNGTLAEIVRSENRVRADLQKIEEARIPGNSRKTRPHGKTGGRRRA